MGTSVLALCRQAAASDTKNGRNIDAWWSAVVYVVCGSIGVSDGMAGSESRSFGAEEYWGKLSAVGLSLADEYEDEGRNHYFDAVKAATELAPDPRSQLDSGLNCVTPRVGLKAGQFAPRNDHKCNVGFLHGRRASASAP